jgi:hypothetical protein
VTRKTDTAPTPVITFATPEAGNRVVADLRAKYEEAARYASAKGGLAVQRGEEIAVLEQEINERQAWIIQKDGAKRQAEAEAQAARDVAQGYAAMLAAAGVHVPPHGGELSHNPDGNLRNLVAAHEELERANGGVS